MLIDIVPPPPWQVGPKILEVLVYTPAISILGTCWAIDVDAAAKSMVKIKTTRVRIN
jgi:hypothetical protein